MDTTAQGAIIEIIENSPRQLGEVPTIIVPNEVRINGQPLLCSAERPVTVHGMVFGGQNGAGDPPLVQVTLTLFARRVFLGHVSESPETGGQ